MTTGLLSIYSWYCIIAGVLSLSVNSLKAEHSVEILEPDSINVGRISTLHRPAWQLNITTENQTYRMVLYETQLFKDEFVASHWTRGVVSQGHNDSWVECGTASIVIGISPNREYRAQGSFVIGPDAYLIRPGSRGYEIWKQQSDNDSTLNPLGTERRSADDNSIASGGESTDNEQLSGNSWSTYVANRSQDCFNGYRTARIGVAADSSYIASFDSMLDARLHISDIVNQASTIWENDFNVTLILSEILTAHEGSKSYTWNLACNVSEDSITALETRLQTLNDWRSTDHSVSDGLALWVMLTNCPSGDVLGLARQGSVCNNGVNIVRHSVLDYRVLAHEIGHVFGAVHDCTNKTCGPESTCCPLSRDSCDAGGAYIMNPETNTEQSTFSSCSRNSICRGLTENRINMSCLSNTTKSAPHRLSDDRCSSIIDPLMADECLKNQQCKDLMGSEKSFYCGSPRDCKLYCYDADAQQCKESSLPFLDGTPCMLSTNDPNTPEQNGRGLCSRGSCKRVGSSSSGWKNWIWICTAIGTAVACAIIVMLVLYLFWSIKAAGPQRSGVSGKKRRNHGISRGSPAKGLPPFLEYPREPRASSISSSTYDLSPSSSTKK